MEGTPLLRLFLPRPGFTRYLMQRSQGIYKELKMSFFFKNNLPGFRLALMAFVLAFVVVGLGAFTRLVDAGLGCPDWPGCYGHLLWPDQEHEIALANRAFPDTPVIDGKAWPEMVHRYFAGILGLLILAIAVVAVRKRSIQGYPFRQPLFMLVLVVVQALFGMWTVTLKLWPQVVTLHLMGGFATLALLAVLMQRLSGYRWVAPVDTIEKLLNLKPWLILGIVVVAVQVSLGGWTASNYAAFACLPGEFPSCQGSYWPDMDFLQGFNILQDIGPNYLGGLLDNEARTAIHYIHRTGALITTVYLLILFFLCLRTGYKPMAKSALFMLVVLAVQVILGVGNVMMAMPLAIAVAHNIVGAVLLAVVSSMTTQSIGVKRTGS